MRRENHIRSKYKLKTWIVPGSEPPLNGYAEPELRALNNRACEMAFRPLLAQTCQRAPPMPFIEVVKTITNTPNFQKPLVKLPPGDEDECYKENTFEAAKDFEMVESASTTGELSVVEDCDAEKLPGMRWTERWKETALAESALMTAKQDVVKRDSRIDMTARGPTAVQHHATPLGGKFKVNIPLLSAYQLKFYPAISRQWPSEERHVTFPSRFCQTSFEIPVQAMSPTLPVMISLPVEKSCQTSPAPTRKPANEVAKVDIAGEDYSNQKHSVITKNLQSPTKEKFSSITGELPTFPFTETIKTFPFKPILDSLEPISLPAPTTIQSRSSIVLSGPTTIPNLNIRKSRPHNNKSTVCHEWNYYMPCIPTKCPHCPRLHVCEICSSREHRATQHWHHLATAPLPEIQSQPKLSSFAPAPESPTLSALRELRAPPRLAPPCKSVVGSIQEGPMFGISHVSPFIPSFGLGGGVESSSPDRLRPRKRPCRTVKTSPPPPMEIKNGSDRELPAVEGDAAQIARIPRTAAYPFEKPLEVILPPPVKPFQRKAAMVENSVPREPTPPPQPATSAPSRLRVTAPAFEPSSPSSSPLSAWVPFIGSNPQFNGLFKIPSRQNRRIAIIPPREIHKKPKEQKSESASKQRENKRRGKDCEEEKEGSLKSKRDCSDNASQMKGAAEKPPDQTKGGHGGISSAQLGSASTKTLTKQKCDTYGPTSSAFIDETASGIWAGSIPIYTMANFDHLKDHFHIYAKTRPPFEGPCDVEPSASGGSTENFPGLASSLCFDSVDRSVIAILDDELEAIMAKASEEEVAKTLETIIEICATPSSSCVTTTSQQSKSPQRRPLQTSPARNLTLSTPTTPPSFAAPGTRFVTLEDFADDMDSALRSIDAAEGPAPTEPIRPRSSDSSSTAPLSPCGSPHSARTINTRTPSASAVPFRPVRSRLEQMMSCAAARGEGQCDCGLGDWFHHGTAR